MDNAVLELTRAHLDDVVEYLPVHTRITMLLVVVVPFLALIASILFIWSHGWIQLGVVGGMYLLTALGLTAGSHRLFAFRMKQSVRSSLWFFR